MSFVPTLARFAPRPLVSGKKLDTLPKSLKKRVNLAEKREANWEKAKAEAIATGTPIPLFNPPKPVEGLQWYRVTRSHNGAYPVYTEIKNNGVVRTVLRRIEGDSASLQRELNEFLRTIHIDPLKAAPQAIRRPTSGNLILPGRLIPQITEFLKAKNF